MRLLEGCLRWALHARRRSRRCKEAQGRGEQPADAQDAQHARVQRYVPECGRSERQLGDLTKTARAMTAPAKKE